MTNFRLKAESLNHFNIKIILNGKEISYEEAKIQFEENTFTRVNVSRKEGERPVLEVATE